LHCLARLSTCQASNLDKCLSRLWMFHAGRASERPGLRDLWPTRLLANFWQNGFLMTSPLEGESENRRVYIGDLNGGPGWTWTTDLALIRGAL